MRSRHWPALAAGLMLQFALAAPAYSLKGVNSAEDLLSRLSHTLQEKNYRGLLTYEFGGTLDTLEIVHLVKDGREYERLHHLSGPAREFHRDGRPVTCVNTAARLLRQVSLPSGEADGHLQQHYDFNLGGTERVADRVARVVRLVPKDQYRYGLALSVDQATGFPVKTLVISEDQTVLERIQFVELELGISPESVALDKSGNAYRATDRDCDLARTGAAESPAAAATFADQDWQAGWLPDGFVLAEKGYDEKDGHHLVFTDGLTSFSVFVTPAESLVLTQPRLARRGATVALMLRLPPESGGVNVAVVGEVPPVTAEQVALRMRPAAVSSEGRKGAEGAGEKSR